MKLTRYDPFRDIESFFPWPRLRAFDAHLAAAPEIRLDVTEDDKAYYVNAEMPGVKKEDIDIQVEGNQVSLAAEVKRVKEEKKDEKVVYSERAFGRQYRSFTLPAPVDRDKVTAAFKDGVLQLTLPKNGSGASRRITVQ